MNSALAFKNTVGFGIYVILIKNSRFIFPKLRYYNCYNVQKNFFQTSNSQFLSFSCNHLKNYNILNYLNKQYELQTLKKEWDTNFNIEDFKSGAKHALCTVVNLIQDDKWSELRGLISSPILEKYSNDSAFLEKIRNLKRLSVDDISNIDVLSITLLSIVEKRYCDIDIEAIIKNSETTMENGGRNSLDIIVFRLHREYTIGKFPEWTITKLSMGDQRS